jgi:hypothetical protein
VKTKFFNLLFNVLVSLLFGAVSALVYGVDAIVASLFTFVILSGLRLIVALSNQVGASVSLHMAVQKEVWENFIAENLYKSYSWIKRSKDRSANVLSNAVVHIPQAGARPKTSKNRENFPIPIVRRNDDDITYPIDELSTESTHIPDADKVELSYDKISSVYMDHVNQLSEDSAKDILDRWYPSLARCIKRTTGTAVASHLSGSTGNRKRLLAVDISTAKTQLIIDTRRETGDRSIILSEEMYNQLKADPTVTNKDTMDSVGAVWRNGDLVGLHGFDIIRTNVTGRYDNTATPVKRDYTLAGAATDNDVVLLIDWQYAHHALGTPKFFEGKDDVHFQGDIYNALIRFGGRLERKNQEGVVAIVQEP